MKQRRRLFNLVQGGTRFDSVKNEAQQNGRIYLYDEISWFGVTAADFVAELIGFGDAPVDLHVNSPGGDVFEGLAMLNSLRSYPGKVTAYVDGIAASAASFLIMGADEVIMSRNSEIMIHDAWGLCLGNSADMRDTAERLDKVSDNIASIYAGRTGGETATWRKAMLDETWYSDEDAVSAGLADAIFNATNKADDSPVFDLQKFRASKSTTNPTQEESSLDFEWAPAAFLRAFEEATR